jgi:hypothetical protein
MRLAEPQVAAMYAPLISVAERPNSRRMGRLNRETRYVWPGEVATRATDDTARIVQPYQCFEEVTSANLPHPGVVGGELP